jgi:YfiH family protein
VECFEYCPDSRLQLDFFTRRGGVSPAPYDSLNASLAVGDDARNVRENLARARQAIGVQSILLMNQIHSDKILTITGERTPPRRLEGDACITDRAGLALGLTVADCLPVYIYGAYADCIGIAHCGWRGTAARLAEKTARQMSRRFHVRLSDLRFALGPCICPNCCEVGEDVQREFDKSFPWPGRFFSSGPGAVPAGHSPIANRHSPFAKYRLDLRAANRWLLAKIGLLETKSIERCTYEDADLFYSARRDRTTGRNLAVIALRQTGPQPAADDAD